METQTQTERFQELGNRLYDAALEGNEPALLNLLHGDPLILDRCTIEKTGSFAQSPLHVAANQGHIEFTIELLRRRPELAEVVDQSQRSTPLHLSSAKGYSEIVRALTDVNHDLCHVKDRNGWNPVHVAAIKGQNHVLDELLRANLQAAHERTTEGETVLHLCVKYSQPETLKFLMKTLDDGQLIKSKDGDGNTILHLAVAAKQPEVVKFLLKEKRIEKNAINNNGLTAMDTLIQSRNDLNDGRIWRSLKRAKVLRAKAALKPKGKPRPWLEKKTNSLMIVASLIATMAFQVGTNPPGGTWQDDNDGHIAGYSIMDDKSEGKYRYLLRFNTVGLVSSLSVILLLISGLPCQRLFVVILTVTMWIAITGTTMTYLMAISFLSPFKGKSKFWTTETISLMVWLVLMMVLLVWHALRFLVKLIKKLVLFIIKLCRRCFTSATCRPPV